MDGTPATLTHVSTTTGSLEWDGAPSNVQQLGPAFHARTYLIDRAMRRLAPRRLLDVGCGRGHVTAIAARHAGEVVAADLASGAANATREALRRHPNANVVVANVLDGSWDDAGFDTVLLSEVLEHLEGDVDVLRACRELLVDGGHLVLTVPADPTLWTRWDDLAGHLRRYTRNDLLAKLSIAGFRVRELVNWGFPVTGWLAIRGARMRANRVAEQHPGGEVPSLFARLLPMATVLFRIAPRLERLLSFLDRGAGYVVVAERIPDDELDDGAIDVAA